MKTTTKYLIQVDGEWINHNIGITFEEVPRVSDTVICASGIKWRVTDVIWYAHKTTSSMGEFVATAVFAQVDIRLKKRREVL